MFFLKVDLHLNHLGANLHVFSKSRPAFKNAILRKVKLINNLQNKDSLSLQAPRHIQPIQLQN